MSSFLKKIIVFLGIVTATATTVNLTSSAPVSAANNFTCRYFAGLTSWDCHVKDMSSEADLTYNIATIATNVLTDITVVAAYLVLAYVIYGGYLYMFSSGDPGKATTGKKALQHAFIGLAIVGSAYVIFGAIRVALIGNANLGSCNPLSGSPCIEPGEMVTNLIQWFIAMAGVVSVIFVVVGGWGYITASGDPGKLQKAKSTITYALIGLVIVALAEVLTAFISNLIRDANNTSYVQTTEMITNINKENLS